jgi:hypothetical protein
MKKYLFGLGAMLVGAGLMFVLMHGEVSADSKPEVPEPFVCSELTVTSPDNRNAYQIPIYHCTAKNILCGLTNQGSVSCVKTGIF